MVDPPEFRSLEEMEGSEWLRKIKHTMFLGSWPQECVRCQETEPDSIRTYANKLHEATERKDYLQVGGVLDNLCNAACLTCDERHSTQIGSFNSRSFPVVDNSQRFNELVQERVVHLDINGGEPSYSKNYKKLLQNLPPNLKTLRLNTNCSTVLYELEDIARRGIEVTVTVSCDGIGPVHERVRWPLKWDEFFNNLMIYRHMPIKLNLWTTVSVLNADDLANIQNFARQHGIDHSFAYLKHPYQLSVHNRDEQARDEYILAQHQLRKIK